MSDHTFKTNFDELPVESQLVQKSYDSPANVRNIVFVLSSGNEVMRNYAYLVGVDLLKNEEKNLLEVRFTSDTILIEGYKLVLLRDLFLRHLPKSIAPTYSRYYSSSNNLFIAAINIK
jgi:hypothetical protein